MRREARSFQSEGIGIDGLSRVTLYYREVEVIHGILSQRQRCGPET